MRQSQKVKNYWVCGEKLLILLNESKLIGKLGPTAFAGHTRATFHGRNMWQVLLSLLRGEKYGNMSDFSVVKGDMAMEG